SIPDHVGVRGVGLFSGTATATAGRCARDTTRSTRSGIIRAIRAIRVALGSRVLVDGGGRSRSDEPEDLAANAGVEGELANLPVEITCEVFFRHVSGERVLFAAHDVEQAVDGPHAAAVVF